MIHQQTNNKGGQLLTTDSFYDYEIEDDVFQIDGKKVIMGEQWVHIGSRQQSGPFSDALLDPEDGLYWDSFPVLHNVDGGDTYDMDNKLFYDFYDIDPIDCADYCVSD